MAEKREWTMVSQLVGQIEFNVAGGKDPAKDDYIPPTKGFVIKVQYASESEKMKEALNSTRIAVQNTIRTFYRKNKKFPFAPGRVQVVNGSGEFTLPMVDQLERLARQIAADPKQLSFEDKVRLAKLLGLPEPVREEMQPEMDHGILGVMAEVASEVSDDPESQYKYDEEQLGKLSLAKLRVLAQNEELEGYDEMTKAEIVEELALLEN